MLAAVRRSCRFSLPRFLQWRGIGTYHQQSRSDAGSRRPNKPVAPAPAAPPGPPEKEEWWVVDGELFKSEKFDPKAVLAPLENEHIPNRRRRKERIKHLALTRLKLRTNGQEAYWSAYMRRYQILRNDWEKLVWDPKPAPPPKTRKASLIAKDAEKYVWKDPQREAFVNTFQNTWMDESNPNAKYKKLQSDDRYPFASQRTTGVGRSFRERTMPPESGDYRLSSKQDKRQPYVERSREKGRDQMWHRDTRSSEDNEDKLKDIECSSEGEENELESIEFSWDESESGDETGSDDQSESEDEDEDNINVRSQKLDLSNDRDLKPKRRGWYGGEDDLFKDDDEED